MATPFLEARNGYRYEFKPLTRRQKKDFSKLVKELNENGDELDKLENLVKISLKENYPNLTDEEYEDILDYNCETYGFNETYEVLGYIIEDVFTQTGGRELRKNSYLEEKRLEKEIEKEQNNKVEIENNEATPQY